MTIGFIERNIPPAAKTDPVSNIGVARCAKKLWIVGRHLITPLAETGCVVNTVTQGVCNRKVNGAETRVSGPLRQTRRQCVVICVYDVFEFIESREGASGPAAISGVLVRT